MTNLLLSTTMGLSEVLGLSGFGFGIVLVVLAFLAIFVLGLSSFFKKNKKEKEETPEKHEAVAEVIQEAPVVAETTPQDSVYTGYVTLEGLSEQDAAVVMAITSHKTGIPLERLGFCSIKLKSPELIKGRYADTLEPEFEKAKAEIGDKAKSDEDVLSYIAFPAQAEKFFDYREEMKDKTYTYEFKSVE